MESQQIDRRNSSDFSSGGSDNENYENWPHGQLEYLSTMMNRDRLERRARTPSVGSTSRSAETQQIAAECSDDHEEDFTDSQVSRREKGRMMTTRERSSILVDREGSVEQEESQRGRPRERERSSTVVASSSAGRLGSPFPSGLQVPYMHKSQIRYKSSSQRASRASTPLASSITFPKDDEGIISKKGEENIKVKLESGLTPQPSSRLPPGTPRAIKQSSTVHTPVHNVQPPIPEPQPKYVSSPMALNNPPHRYQTRSSSRVKSESVSAENSPSPQPLSLRKGILLLVASPALQDDSSDPQQSVTFQESQTMRWRMRTARSASPAPTSVNKIESDNEHLTTFKPSQTYPTQTDTRTQEVEQTDAPMKSVKSPNNENIVMQEKGEASGEEEESEMNLIKTPASPEMHTLSPPLPGVYSPTSPRRSPVSPAASSLGNEAVLHSPDEETETKEKRKVKVEEDENHWLPDDIASDNNESNADPGAKSSVYASRRRILISSDSSFKELASPPISIASSAASTKTGKQSHPILHTEQTEKIVVEEEKKANQSLEELPGKKGGKLFLPRSSSSDDVEARRLLSREDTDGEIEAMLLSNARVRSAEGELSEDSLAETYRATSEKRKGKAATAKVDNEEDMSRRGSSGVIKKEDDTVEVEAEVPSRLSSNSPSYIQDESEYKTITGDHWSIKNLGASPPSIKGKSSTLSRSSSGSSVSSEASDRGRPPNKSKLILTGACGLQADIGKWSISPSPWEEQPVEKQPTPTPVLHPERENDSRAEPTATASVSRDADGASMAEEERPAERRRAYDTVGPQNNKVAAQQALVRRSSNRAPPKAHALSSGPKVEAASAGGQSAAHVATRSQNVAALDRTVVTANAPKTSRVIVNRSGGIETAPTVRADLAVKLQDAKAATKAQIQEDVTVSLKLSSLPLPGSADARSKASGATTSSRAMGCDIPNWIHDAMVRSPTPGDAGLSTVSTLPSAPQQTTAVAPALRARHAPMLRQQPPLASLSTKQDDESYQMTCPRCQDCGSTDIANLEYYGQCAIANASSRALQSSLQTQPPSILKQEVSRAAEDELTFSETESSCTSVESSSCSHDEGAMSDVSDMQSKGIDEEALRGLLDRVGIPTADLLRQQYMYKRRTQHPAVPSKTAQKKVRIVTPERDKQATSRKLVSSDHEKARSIPEKRFKKEMKPTLSQKVNQAVQARHKEATKTRFAPVLSDLPSTRPTWRPAPAKQTYNMSDLPMAVRACSSAAVSNRPPGPAQKTALGEVAKLLPPAYMAVLGCRSSGYKRDQSASGPSHISNVTPRTVTSAAVGRVPQSGTLVVRDRPTRQAAVQQDKGNRDIKPSANKLSKAKGSSPRLPIRRAGQAENDTSEEDISEYYDDSEDEVAPSPPAKKTQPTKRTITKPPPLKQPTAQTAGGPATRKRRARSDEATDLDLQIAVAPKRVKVEVPETITGCRVPPPVNAGQNNRASRNARNPHVEAPAPVPDRMRTGQDTRPAPKRQQHGNNDSMRTERGIHEKERKIVPMPLPGNSSKGAAPPPLPKRQAARALRQPQPPVHAKMEEKEDLADYFVDEYDEELEAGMEGPLPTNYRFPKTPGRRAAAAFTIRSTSKSYPEQTQTSLRATQRTGISKFVKDEAEISNDAEEDEYDYDDPENEVEGYANRLSESEEEPMPKKRARKNAGRSQVKTPALRAAQTKKTTKQSANVKPKKATPAPRRGRAQTAAPEEDEDSESAMQSDYVEEGEEEYEVPAKKAGGRKKPAQAKAPTRAASRASRGRGRGRGK